MTVSPDRYLRFFLVVLFLIPAYYVFPGLGAAGSLPTLLGVVALVWWLFARFAFGNRETAEANPIRWALLAYTAVVIASWTVGKSRVLTPVAANQSDRSLIIYLGVLGIGLVALDGLRTRAQIERMARIVAAAAMIMVVAGLLEFYAGFDLALSLRPPGLINNFAETELETRSIFTRPRGTSMHPIEFGVVGAGLIPVAYWARLTRPGRRLWVLPLAALGFAAMISLSRSAVLAAATATVVLLVALPWRQRAAFVILGAAFVVAAGVAVSGLVGTLRALITQTDTDPSVQARVQRFPLVMELVAEHPWFGRGYGTFTIADGFLLDNQVHGQLITMGLVGVAALALLVAFVVAVAWRTRRHLPWDQGVAGAALAATILAFIVSAYTFDAFFYQILTNLLYLSIGMVGALWRVTAHRDTGSTNDPTTGAESTVPALAVR